MLQTTDCERETARQALARTGRFTPEAVRSARFRRLKGLTNRVYKAELETQAYCLRIPGAGTAAFIDRQAEAVNARAAAHAGVAPEVLHFGADGTMLTPYIDAAVTLSAERFRSDPAAVSRAVRALKHLHDGAGDFAREFNVFAIAQDYLRLLRDRGAEIPGIATEAMDGAEAARLALAADPARLRPCHCDPTGANLLDTGERVWLVDLEYSGMNDPMWDLAYLSVQSDFDPALDEALLAGYLGRPPGQRDRSRMALYLALVELLSALWALVQQCVGNTAGDFQGYAAVTFENCRVRMRSPQFRRHLEIVRRG